MAIRRKLAEAAERHAPLKAIGRDPTTLCFDSIVSPTEARLEGRSVTLFGTNNYLGLTFDKACCEAAIAATRSLGVGTTGSRVANGTYDSHRDLEKRVARFYGRRDAIVFSTGYVANLGTICALAGRGDHLLIDADSHASIYDACKMSGAEIIRFRHNNAADLEKKLARLSGTSGAKLIIVEGVYSMLGDSAPLAEIVEVKRRAGDDVYLLVDEAHSLGVLGERGRGLAEAVGVEADCDFIVGTFSKSVGTIGGYCVSDLEHFDAVRSLSRPYMFTASPTPGVVAAAAVAFERIEIATDLRQSLRRNVETFYGGLSALGLELGPQPSAVVAVICPGPEAAVALWNGLIDAGVYTNIALPPATPNGLALIRTSVSAAHTPQQIRQALEAFRKVADQLGMISDARPALRVVDGRDDRVREVVEPLRPNLIASGGAAR